MLGRHLCYRYTNPAGEPRIARSYGSIFSFSPYGEVTDGIRTRITRDHNPVHSRSATITVDDTRIERALPPSERGGLSVDLIIHRWYRSRTRILRFVISCSIR